MKVSATIIFIFILQIINSQNKEIFDPKGKWFFGVEVGTNEITSLNLGEDNLSFQGGILAEYYFSKNWSISGRIKYFETGISYFNPGSNSGSGGIIDIGWGTHAKYGKFNGNIIAIPLNVK
jgi:hypothetical protein